MPFIGFKRLEIHDVILIEPTIYKDKRGFFLESYKKSDFEKYGFNFHFVQDNHSKSVKGVLRGLHFQIAPKAQGKLVRCITGKILDVAVDIRKKSPTYKKYVAVELIGDDQKALYVPPGFAHGFVTLSDEADVFYKTTEEYSSAQDMGLRWNDPDINIKWPISDPIVSDKDAMQPLLKDIEHKLLF
ncbi:MAG: dTDP-4-dehydrorhamnose 3,5-epimerase [Planctomycetes bacterium]|nr:dTDP-4-dehydrorhamnose 3,5-epimerase [Planctomycetota bacterium]